MVGHSEERTAGLICQYEQRFSLSQAVFLSQQNQDSTIYAQAHRKESSDHYVNVSRQT